MYKINLQDNNVKVYSIILKCVVREFKLNILFNRVESRIILSEENNSEIWILKKNLGIRCTILPYLANIWKIKIGENPISNLTLNFFYIGAIQIIRDTLRGGGCDSVTK